MNLTQKILKQHLVSGSLEAGSEIGLKIDQTLTQDATGTLAWLQFAALGVPRVQVDLAVSYVDHSTLQMDFKNPDDHRFLAGMAAKYGGVFSPAGTGICHQLHLENFAKPGTTLLGSDSHTPTAGGVGALAMGAGGLSVALAMAGKSYNLPMPQVVKVDLVGELQGFTEAKDIILEVLRQCTVKGGVGKVFEYVGSGVLGLSVPERATITNMGAELGATSSIFPSDERTLEFLTQQGRPEDFVALAADANASYDAELSIDLSILEPLAACPHGPDQVVKVSDLSGLAVDQVCIGSCTNSSYADLMRVGSILQEPVAVDTLLSPGSRQVVSMLESKGMWSKLLNTGVRFLECACGPCIGSGGAPVSAGVSVRTFNRNFLGRSGTQDAEVYLVSPSTAAMVAKEGKFTDPKTWGQAPAKAALEQVPSMRHLFKFPPLAAGATKEVVYGPNIVALQDLVSLKEPVTAEVVIQLADNITTDHIMPAGAEILALRSNIPAIAQHVLTRVDPEFVAKAQAVPHGVIVAGENYGQGSSREHAALAPRYLGIKAVLAQSIARIHQANLINFGILPLIFVHKQDYDQLLPRVSFELNLQAVQAGQPLELVLSTGYKVLVTNSLSVQELTIIKAGGLINFERS